MVKRFRNVKSSAVSGVRLHGCFFCTAAITVPVRRTRGDQNQRDVVSYPNRRKFWIYFKLFMVCGRRWARPKNIAIIGHFVR